MDRHEREEPLPIRSLIHLTRAAEGESIRSSRKLLTKDVFDTDTYEVGGITLLRNPDPILRYVAPKGDESQWRSMERSNDKLASCKKHIFSLLLGPGSKVVVGSKKDKEANRLRDFVIANFRGIHGWNTALQKIGDAVWWGWRPLRLEWTPKFQWEGRSNWWGVKRIREKDPWNYAFTADELLARKPSLGSPNYEIVNRGLQKMNWLLACSGSNNTPYGEAEYQDIYLLAYAKERMFQMAMQGTERSMGMLKVTEKAGATQAAGDDSTEAMNRIVEEVRDIVDVLAQNNILIQRGNLVVDMLSDIQYADGWQGVLDYLDNCITLLMLGENLSMHVGAKGSYSAVEAQIEGVAKQYIRRHAANIRSVINDQLIPYMIQMNFGQREPEEMPRLQFEVESEINLEATRALFDMGATIDGAEVGRRFGVPVLAEGGGKESGAIPLKKVEPTMDQPGPTPSKSLKDRNDKKAKDDRTTGESRSAPEVMPSGAEASLVAFWEENARRFIRDNDPFL